MNLSPKILELREKARQEALRRVQRDRKKAPERLHPILDAIADNLLNPQLNVSFVERVAGTYWRERQMFSDHFGMPIKKYLDSLKEIMATWLLVHTNLAISVVARTLNYLNASNFSQDFRRWASMPPKSYREEHSRQSTPLHRVIEELFGEQPLWIPDEAGRKPAEWVWRHLRGEPPRRRRRLLKAEIATASPALFELLSEESRMAGRQDCRKGLQLAEDALAHVKACERYFGDRFGGIHALALARLANAQRLAGDLTRATKYFARAWDSFSKAKQRDSAIEAEIVALEGSLYLLQRDLPKALEKFDHSMALALDLNDVNLQVDAYLGRTAAYYYSNEPEKMLPELEAAMRKLEAHRPGDRLRLLGVCQDLLLAYLETDNLSEAEKLLPEARDLCEELDYAPSIHRLMAIEGLICKKKETSLRAERLLREAITGLTEQGDLAAAALVGLDLAILFQEQGRSSAVQRIVLEEILPMLESLRIHREALAALKLLQKSVETEITVDFLQQARELLRGVLQDPGRCA